MKHFLNIFVILLKLQHLKPTLSTRTCPVMLDEMNSEVYPTDLDLHFISLFHLLVTTVCAVLSSPLHRRVSMLDFYFDHSEERPLEAFEDIFASYENKK